MQTMSDAWVQASKNQRYYIKAVCDGVEITDQLDNLEYSGYFNSEGKLTIGNVCSSTISFNILNPTQSYAGKTLEISYGLEIDGELEYIRLGYFTCTKPEINNNKATYTAYDDMATELDRYYVSDLVFPTTDTNIYNEIATQTGIAIVLPDNFTEHTISGLETQYTYRELLAYLVAMQGCNAFVNRNGELEVKWYDSVDFTITDDEIYSEGAVVEAESDFQVQYIVCQNQSIDGAITQISTGEGDMGIEIENPFFTQSILEEVFAKIQGFTYRIANAKFKGDWRIDLGDVVTLSTNGNTYSLPLMMITHSCDGGLVTNVSSFGETETESMYVGSNPTTKYKEEVGKMINALNEAVVGKLSVTDLQTKELTANNLNITGGSVKITTIEDTDDYIELTSGQKTIYIAPSYVRCGYAVTGGTNYSELIDGKLICRKTGTQSSVEVTSEGVTVGNGQIQVYSTTGSTVTINRSGITVNNCNITADSNSALIGNLQGNADTSTKATQDGNGNVISSTYAKLSSSNTFTKNQFVDNNVYWGVTATNGEKRGGITIDNNNDYMIATGGISSGENKRNIYIGSASAVDKIYLQSENGVSLPLVSDSIPGMYGVKLKFYKQGRFVLLKIEAMPTTDIIPSYTGSGNRATIRQIPQEYAPSSDAGTQINYVYSGTTRFQANLIQVDSSINLWALYFASSADIASGTNRDIAKGVYIATEIMYVSAN